MKCWVLFENNEFVSKTYEECYANLDQLKGTGIENITDYKFVECDCQEDEIMYYDEEDKLKCCKTDKDIDKEINERHIKRFNIVEKEPIDLEKENKELKTEITGVKDILNKLLNAKSFSDFKKNIT
tara:strand:+ start:501 stop:878 length:378 start_codon:yes stop_codon:yes gene_type:complete